MKSFPSNCVCSSAVKILKARGQTLTLLNDDSAVCRKEEQTAGQEQLKPCNMLYSINTTLLKYFDGLSKNIYIQFANTESEEVGVLPKLWSSRLYADYVYLLNVVSKISLKLRNEENTMARHKTN